jgi:GTP pyrophosphokinase
MPRDLEAAFSLAAEWHATQVRKATSIPYVSHLMSVSALVMEHGGDEVQAVAGLLHDAVEDADTKEEAERRRGLIKDRFGDRVAKIVNGCTDGTPDGAGKKPDWTQRKEAYLKHLGQADDDTLLVSAADKLHNARAIVADLRVVGDTVFSRFTSSKEKTLWYYGRLSETFQQRLPGPLSSELARTVEMMKAIAK